MEDLLRKLNDLYTELEFEKDKDIVKNIKRQIKTIERKLEEEENDK